MQRTTRITCSDSRDNNDSGMGEKALEEKRIMHMACQHQVERFKAEHHRFEVLSEVSRPL